MPASTVRHLESSKTYRYVTEKPRIDMIDLANHYNAVNNNPLWATGFQNFPANDAFFNRPIGAALGNIRLPNNGQQDNGILQNPAILPNLSDNRDSHPFLERHSEEFHLTNPVFQTLLGTSLVHPADGGNNSGIPIPKTSGDFPAESSIGQNNNDVGQNQSGDFAQSTTSTQTESFDHFNPLPPVVPTSGNSHDRGRVCVNYPFALSTTSTQTESFDHIPLSHVVSSSGISHDCAKVYVNHPGDGRGTTFVDEESLPEESRTLSQYEGSRTASVEPFDNTANRAQFTKELPLSNKEGSGGFGGKQLNSLIVCLLFE
ncbi:unnamed protein product [Angiostrongylus costaricensis]|uniref:Ski_Sno domain-containing protein n=1 Tax=Angiostrongylus costaricensis TaxID=334426 RepID=A0A0R3Q047_ANGCS|nr:unnamed protein product [Angiostrongylus costaricensis]